MTHPYAERMAVARELDDCLRYERAVAAIQAAIAARSAS